MKSLFTLLFSSLLLMSSALPALAQMPFQFDPTRPETANLGPETAAGDLRCFDYYTFGSVQADLQTNLAQTVPGATLTFSGQIKNDNNYPLLQGKLSVKIFKKDDTSFAAGDGNVVVDQFTIMEDITLPAQGTKDASFDWRVPNNADGGEYYAAYFFTTSDRYNLMGLSFTDDVVGNTAQFTVTNEASPTTVRLSKVDTTLNERNHNFAGFPLSFPQSDTVVIKTTISNPSDQPKTIPLQWNQYAWDAQNDENRRNTETLLVGLEPGQTREISYTVKPQREAVVYVTATTQDRDAKSILNIRYVRDGVEETRINFPGLTAFPLQAGVEQTLFACAHSTNLPVVPGNILTLTLTDRAGAVIHQYRYEGDITGAMAGFGEAFTPGKNVNYALLTASLERDGVVVEEVKVEYDCQAIDPNSCLPEESENAFLDFLKAHVQMILIAGGVLVVMLLILFFIKNRKIHIKADTNMMPPLSILFLMLLLPGLFFATSAEAKSTSWNSGELPYLVSYINLGGTRLCIARCDDDDPDRWNYGEPIYWMPVGDLDDTNVTVSRTATVRNNTTNSIIEDGAELAVGQSITFIPKIDERSDISWNGVGRSSDTPNGYWNQRSGPGANACASVNSNTFVPGTGSASYETFVSLTLQSVAPTITHSGTAQLTNCTNNGFTCTVSSAGTINSTITWGSTSGYFDMEVFKGGQTNPPSADWMPSNICNVGTPMKLHIGQFDHTGVNNPDYGSAPIYNVAVPAQSISFSLSATAAANAAPNAPTITGTTSAPINVSHSFGLTATDPDGDAVRYGIDFNGDNEIDQWLPGSGHVNSGTVQNLARSWATAGQITFRALTEDLRSAQSGWTTHTVTLVSPTAPPTPPPASCTDGIMNQDETGVDTGGICTPPPPPLIGLSFYGPWQGRVNKPYTFYLRSYGTDTSDVRYFVDWNRNGSNVAWLPSQTGYLPAGTEASTQQSWTTAGLKLFSGTVTNTNNRSAQLLYSFLVAAATDPYVDLMINNSDGPLSVNRSETLNVTWESQGVGNCVLYGDGVPNGGESVQPSGSMQIPANGLLSTLVNYMIICDGYVDQLQVTVVNSAPNAPTITHPTGSADQNVTTTFTVTATDPDGDNIYYEIDWDNNGGADATSQTVPSGQSIQANRSWPTAGTYIIQARAIDFPGRAESPWTQYTITVNNSAPSNALIEVQINGGAWSADDQTIDPGDSINLRWSSTDATTCVGTNFNTGGNPSGNTGVPAPGPNSATDFSVSCSGNGAPGSDSLRVSTRALPNFNQPNVTYQLSSGFDPVTGIYDSVTVIFQTTNDGGSATKANAEYQVRFDRGTDGYDETQTGNLGLLATGQAANRTVVFNNVSFSGNRIEVTVDATNAVAELNESDNVRVLDMTLAPPDPNLEITASRPAVRGGETVTLSWNTNATYPMNCSVFGPGVGPINFNPSVAGPTGNTPTQPINAKSEFTIRCTEPISNTTFTDATTVEIVGSLEEI